MAIKLTVMGLLIYAAWSIWLAAICLLLSREFERETTAPALPSRIAERLFGAGFVVLLGAFICRWFEVGHVPLQNMFEVFLCLGLLMFPLWWFCHNVLKVPGMAGNLVVGLIVLFPAGVVFRAEPQVLPPALQSWLFTPHVGAYMLAYVVLGLAAPQAIAQLRHQALGQIEASRIREQATYTMIRLGFPLLTLGLVLGAVWGKLAWGDYWNWDPKELWSLATFLVYVAYLHVRSLYGARHSGVNSALVLAGLLGIVLTLLWVNLSRIFPGMHSYAS